MADDKKPRYYLPKNTFVEKYFREMEPDLEVTVGNEIVKVHKILLTLYSSIFKTQLLECKQNDNIVVKCNNVKIFKTLMEILACKRTVLQFDDDISVDEYIELVNLANFYN